MNSTFLTNLGLGGLDIGLIIAILVAVVFILLIFSLITFIKLCKLKKRYLRFSQGKDAGSLEKEISMMFMQNNEIKEQTERNKRDIRDIYKTQETTFQKMGLVKYDAYSQMGGKLSFTLCMLNEKDNGFIMNSIHGSDGCYTYIKEIVGGQCNVDLGKEEEEALMQAINSKR